MPGAQELLRTSPAVHHTRNISWYYFEESMEVVRWR